MDSARKGRAARPSTRSVAGANPVIGRLVGRDPRGGPLVAFDDSPAGPLPARSTVPIEVADVARGREVLVLFERGDAARPVVVGLMQPTEQTPYLEMMLEPAEAGQDRPSVEARADGRRVVLEGDEEVVLRCGEAAITLRKDGKIVLRGTHVLSRAEYVNRIKGGAVQIN